MTQTVHPKSRTALELEQQLQSDLAVILFAHTGQQPQEAVRRAGEFIKALRAEHLPMPSTLPFMVSDHLEPK